MKRISTEINSIARFVGEEKTLYLLAEAGFDCWDFSMFSMAKYDKAKGALAPNDHPLASPDYLAFARKLRRIGEENGITCNQAHAPFPIKYPEILALQKRAIECTAEAGGSICTIHPNNNKSAEENAEIFLELLPFAKEHGVKIATENMWNWNKEEDHAADAACSHHSDFLAHIKAVNDPYLVACLDIGHAEMRGLRTDSETMIRTLGDSLAALHIHDNDLWHDSHELPFTMDIDFEKVIKALKEINYKGDLTLEADRYSNRFAPDDMATCAKNMATAAKRLAKMYEEL